MHQKQPPANTAVACCPAGAWADAARGSSPAAAMANTASNAKTGRNTKRNALARANMRDPSAEAAQAVAGTNVMATPFMQ